VDFAKALQLSIPDEHAALKRWYGNVSTVQRGRLICRSNDLVSVRFR